MKMFYGGTEQKGWRELLYDNGVHDMSLSFVSFLNRKSHPEKISLADEFPDDVNIFLDSGTYTLNKTDSKYTDEDVDKIARQYIEFVGRNHEHIVMASEFNAHQLSPPEQNAINNSVLMAAGQKYLPLWDGKKSLRDMAHLHPRLGVMAADAPSNVPQLNRTVMDTGLAVHGVAMTQIDLMREVKWDSVGSMSWLSPSMHGDTIIWTGHELKRYPKNYKGRGRASHKRWIQDQGFTWSLIDADDYQELLRLSIWSWQQYVDWLNRRDRVTQLATGHTDQNEETGNSVVAHNIGGERNRKLLPILSTQVDERTELDEDGNETVVTESKITTSSRSLMKCDTCPIQDRCPEFKGGNDCAFDIPLDLSLPKSEDAMWITMEELQAKRVLMMNLIEQVNGQYDPNLGTEMDRLVKFMNAKKRNSQTRIRQTNEIVLPAGEGGAINELFGGGTAGKLHEPTPQIEESVVEAEIISDSQDESNSE